MSEPNGGHAVSALGLPGAVVVETSLEPRAPVQSAFRTPTEGMSPTQAATAAWYDARRAEFAAGPTDQTLVRQGREALDHIWRGGPAPAWLPATEASAPPQGEPASAPAPAMPPGYEPMSEAQASLHAAHARNLGVPPQVADAFVDFAKAAQLPEVHASTIRDRLAHHWRTARDLSVSSADRPEYVAEAVRAFGGEDRYREAVAKARGYLESVGALEYVDKHLAGSSLVYDPRILNMLAGLHTARTTA